MEGLHGSYWGKTVRERRLGNLLITASRYGDGESAPEHTHSNATLCMVVGGAFEEIGERESWICTGGAVLFRPRDCPHSNRFLAAGTKTLAIDLPRELEQAGPARPRLVHNSRAAKSIRSLMKECYTLDGFSALQSECLVWALYDEIARIPDEGWRRPPRWLAQIRHRLNDAGTSIPNLMELSSEAGVHPMHLTRSFRGFYGCSVGEYARRRRIERCTLLLESSTKELGEIALEAGFCDQAHFTRSFRAVKGCTPADYRRAIGR